MPFSIVRNDITAMQVDAIVNTANPQPTVGAGTDAAIHAKAGPGLLQARQKIGPIAPGCCAATPAFGLAARYVIHTVGPAWQDGTRGEAALLKNCYSRSLSLAAQLDCTSVAFPLISTGTYGFPKPLALQTAISTISAFLLEHEMMVYLVVYDRQAFRLSEQLFTDVASYIDEHYVTLHTPSERRSEERRRSDAKRRKALLESCADAVCKAHPAPSPDMSESCVLSFETDAGFSETLLALIDRSGEKDAAVYKRANISRQHFSKIRNDPHYKPTKSTALAFAIALRLNLAETRDLLERAGYALSRSSKLDVIVRYFIEQGNYDLFEINAVLFDFDQPLLGS